MAKDIISATKSEDRLDGHDLIASHGEGDKWLAQYGCPFPSGLYINICTEDVNNENQLKQTDNIKISNTEDTKNFTFLGSIVSTTVGTGNGIVTVSLVQIPAPDWSVGRASV